METFKLKITKKHHKHLNNPFPPTPRSLPVIEGPLSFNSETLPSHQIYSIGKDFQILWTSDNGGYLSISHQSHPTRSMWSTIPGQSFVSAALAQTQVEESRGSFLIKDRDVRLLCYHQTIEDIRVINQFDDSLYQKTDLNLKDIQFPVLLITGLILGNKLKKEKKKLQSSGIYKDIYVDTKKPCATSRYWLLFDQKTIHQIGFQLKLGQVNFEIQSRGSAKYRHLRWRRGQIRKKKLGWWCFFTRPKGFARISSSSEEEIGELNSKPTEFNRVCLTYSSERNERFYGFGEQFSHMDFKGKRVPIFVQEQGIGRGDQPITFAANLVSYRAGGDWSTTYAPSPFYMTSKMKSVYLEGYDYSVFDLTRQDRVQIQIHGNSVQGRILHGNSPSELIECLTKTIGRPPELPEWIISGAVAGMQGGTDAVRRVWDALRDYKVPVSAFWLQDWVGNRETLIGSQLWWNWEVDTIRYKGWQQLVNDLNAHHVKVMTYCNPCLAPSDEKPNKRRNLFEEAKKLDILVKDNNGDPYMVPNTAFDVGMLDLTHPDAASWFKQILQEMVEDGVKGWMADFGEGLPMDAVLYSGLNAKHFLERPSLSCEVDVKLKRNKITRVFMDT